MPRTGRWTVLVLASVSFALVGCSDDTVTSPATSADAALAGAPGTTPSNTTLVTARETICEARPGESRLVNGVIHFRGREASTLATSDDPRYTGSAEVVFRGRQEAATGDGRGFGRFSFQPDGIDGSWEGSFTGSWDGGLFSGRGVAHGTGELRGQTLHSRLQEHRVDEGAPTPCPPAVGTQFRHELKISAPRG